MTRAERAALADPERGLVMPAGFIPLAEESGLGHAVGQWVLEAACRQARAWRDGTVGDVAICVNLSASQLRDAGLVADLKKLLERTGCEPGWLEFEITETSMVRDVEGTSLVLAKLRGLACAWHLRFRTPSPALALRHLPWMRLRSIAVRRRHRAGAGARARGGCAGAATAPSAPRS